MTSGQRRALWFCVFAMAFVFFYEASGTPLVRRENIAEHMPAGALREHFQNHAGWGLLFLIFGAVLTRGLRKPETEAPYMWSDWAALAAGLAVLSGTLYHSYRAIAG